VTVNWMGTISVIALETGFEISKRIHGMVCVGTADVAVCHVYI